VFQLSEESVMQIGRYRLRLRQSATTNLRANIRAMTTATLS